jgi:hypothetical protein
MAGKNDSAEFTAAAPLEQTTGLCQRPNEAKGPEEPGIQPLRESLAQQQGAMRSQDQSHDSTPSRSMLDRSLQAQLGRQLRSIFSDIANEPVPDRFVKLLEELEAKEQRQ